MLTNIDPSPPPPEPYPYSENGSSAGKRKRRPAGTPDPDAEVVSLSPQTLLESDRYVCEICNQGFQRDQNLQMHRRRHKVPWKLLKRETPAARKRVFVCPEPSCLHHDPRHALGDLVGIKKHFRRKHSNQKQWVCDKCSKGYAVQSDYKAHLKTCGTRGHSCDCGRVFSRVESFIEHQDACSMGRLRSEHHHLQPPPATASLSRTAPPSSPSPSSDTNLSVSHLSTLPRPIQPIFLADPPKNNSDHPNLELQLLTKASAAGPSKLDVESHSTQLQLSIGSSSEINGGEKPDAADNNSSTTGEKPARLIREEAAEQLRIATAEKAYAEEEFADAKRIRRQAQAELEKAQALRIQATEKVNSAVMQVTCHACKHKFEKAANAAAQWSLFAETNSSSSSSRDNLLGLAYVWEVKKGEGSN
ncbi:protein indeterminate-domain 14 [Phtheirospermum japonicum]|uniref:Protein indeterminate-domain 14 n=1 Tax=Phtheirospermum japonicum TaxID=374723 RepID=A0A830D533_9LAMI|nr:protein indeterminate-domain 14 [Phtheirospermum japonicum]